MEDVTSLGEAGYTAWLASAARRGLLPEGAPAWADLSEDEQGAIEDQAQEIARAVRGEFRAAVAAGGDCFACAPAGAGEASDHDGGSEQPPGNLAARLRAVLLDLRMNPTEARIQALHLLDEDEQRAADLRAHIAGMGGPSPAYVTDDAAGLGSVDIGGITSEFDL